eukprot:UN0914
MREHYFGEGAERLVRGFRLVGPDVKMFVGPRLAAKESRYVHDLEDSDPRKFQRGFCDTQSKAQWLAEVFNARLAKLPGVDNRTPRVSFLECSVYMLDVHKGKRIGLLVEKMLDPKGYKKWNNNAGYVDGMPLHLQAMDGADLGGLQAVAEAFSEEGLDSEDEESKLCASKGFYEISIQESDVPQAFSHFTYRKTQRRMLVCDLQRVLDENSTPPRFEFTDPVIHYRSRTGRQQVFGRTDNGTKGFHRFFETHECSDLCRMLNRRFVRQGEAEVLW